MPKAESPPAPGDAASLRARARQDAAVLASGYTRLQHWMNILGLSAFCVVAILVGAHVFSRTVGWIPLTVGILAGWVLTDFICGLIHWAGDTWGRTGMPIVGRMFVRSFREHHVNPHAITRHGMIQLLGEQAIVAAPMLPVLWLYEPEEEIGLTVLICVYTAFNSSIAANVFHRWAHMRRPPLVARLMQRMGLIIGYRHHARHHRPPYLRNYCIAIGWLNPLLDGVRFWRALEWLVWKTTGAIPREDDLGREAALALMRGDSAHD